MVSFGVVRELEATWAVMEFDYVPHDRTGIKMPRASEEVVETLEDNQVTNTSGLDSSLTFIYLS